MSFIKSNICKIISIFLHFTVTVIGLPSDPIMIGQFAKYKYINAKR